MGSVKDLVLGNTAEGKLYRPPRADEFGQGAWKVSGRFSVADLKEQIPPVEIKDKAAALTMMTARFFEWLANEHPEIPTCYVGVLDEGMVTDTQTLLDKGKTSDIIVMKLAHVPETFCNGDLEKYRAALASGELQCGVADVESIFRKGFPLGSSKFEDIFKAVGMGAAYETMSTYDETVEGLDRIRQEGVELRSRKFPELERILLKSGLGTTIPNPGFVLRDMTYNSTTKFEKAGDRKITKEEEKELSGLDDEGYKLWAESMFPSLARAQIKFCAERGIVNIDGKAECVAYRGKPVVTDFACTVDENRLMIEAQVDGVAWAIPSNKEIQRAIFRREGIYAAVSEAKRMAAADGDKDKWKAYIPAVLSERKIDIKAVAEHSCNLMAYAISEVGNRILGKRVFDAKPLDSWVREFIPYASKLEYQK